MLAQSPAVSLSSHEDRKSVREKAVAELLSGKASYKRTVQLANVRQYLKDQAVESNDQEELEVFRRMEKELVADRAERARMRSGVLRKDQAPQLPRDGMPESN